MLRQQIYHFPVCIQFNGIKLLSSLGSCWLVFILWLYKHNIYSNCITISNSNKKIKKRNTAFLLDKRLKLCYFQQRKWIFLGSNKWKCILVQKVEIWCKRHVPQFLRALLFRCFAGSSFHFCAPLSIITLALMEFSDLRPPSRAPGTFRPR